MKTFEEDVYKRQPAEPVRLRLGEEEEAEVPPGVKIIEHVQNANEFGRYEVMVCLLYTSPPDSRKQTPAN